MGLSRSSSLSSASMKTRALAAAAASVVRHVVEVGACGDPLCLMFYDPDVFLNPLSVSSRYKIASFRKHPGSQHVSTLPSQGIEGHHVTPPMRPDDDHRRPSMTEDGFDHIPNAIEVDDAFEPGELEFDRIHVSRRLFSSIAQQSSPLQEYLLDVLNALSSSSSPLLSTPETFVIALVLLERMQHASLLARAGCGTTTSHHTAVPEAQPPFVHEVLAPHSPTFGVGGPIPVADDRVRSFLDATPQVRLTKESLQSLSSTVVVPPVPSALRSSTPSAAVGQVSDTESNPGAAQSRPAAGGGVFATLCVECLEQPGLALHASNVHLFFAAAVCIAIKLREDFANGPMVLHHLATLLHCPSVRILCLAERCLCDMLKFDVSVTVHEYRAMLRQLSSYRSTTAPVSMSPVSAHTPSRGLSLPNQATSILDDGGVSPQATSGNFMSLFASV
jgi:hypothetical protein